MIYTVEIKYYDINDCIEKTLYFSSHSFSTLPNDTPANTFFAPRIRQPANFKRDIFKSGYTLGKTQVSYGEIIIINNDGMYDFLLPHAFDGRDFIVKVGEEAMLYRDFIVVLQGKIQKVQYELSQISFVIRDRQLELDKVISEEKYKGNNQLPLGIEGLETDLKDKNKNVIFGTVSNIEPLCVNTSKLIYQVSNSKVNDITVYDKGVMLTYGGEVDSLDALYAQDPPEGSYLVYLENGLFRIGMEPSGNITCDVIAHDQIDNNCGFLIKSVIDYAKINNIEISQDDLDEIDISSNYIMGLYCDGSMKCIDIIDQLTVGIGAWWGFDRLGVMRIQRLELPDDFFVTIIDDKNIKTFEILNMNDIEKGIPYYRINLSYDQNYTVQKSNDLAGDPTTDSDPVGGMERRQYLSNEFRKVTAEDQSIKSVHPLADEFSLNSCLIRKDEAQEYADFLLSLYKSNRVFIRCSILVDNYEVLKYLDLGMVVKIIYTRYGFENGKNMRIIGIDSDYSRNLLDLTLWG